MSKTDKTKPCKFAEDHGDRCPFPCKHVSITGSIQAYRKIYVRRERALLRMSIARREEPLNPKHRHSAHWDAV